MEISMNKTSLLIVSQHSSSLREIVYPHVYKDGNGPEVVSLDVLGELHQDLSDVKWSLHMSCSILCELTTLITAAMQSKTTWKLHVVDAKKY